MEREGASFADALLKWHSVTARSFPWRGETDAYKIWISEIMLQQTRTETVKAYYERFLSAFPTVFALADAEESEVLKLWEGLGYYSRARNLHKAAKIVAYEKNGAFPDTMEEMKKLPGIGDYAAGAIASIAFKRRVPALDGNQARVLARVMNIDEVIKTPAVLYDRALRLVPEEEPGEYNQALMGLGAMVCTPKNPKCILCPVRHMCISFCEGTQELLPKKPPKAERKIETRAICMIFDKKGRVYVRKRKIGLLIGLWELPGYANARSWEDAVACLEEDGFEVKYIETSKTAKHIFTHLEWRMTGYVFACTRAPSDGQFVDFDGLCALAMPTAIDVYRTMVKSRLENDA